MSVYDRTIVIDARPDLVRTALQRAVQPAQLVEQPTLQHAVARLGPHLHVFEWTLKDNGTTMLQYWIRDNIAGELEQIVNNGAIYNKQRADITDAERKDAEVRLAQVRKINGSSWLTASRSSSESDNAEIRMAREVLKRFGVSSAPVEEPAKKIPVLRTVSVMGKDDLALMMALGFTAEDVAANRQNRLSERQTDVLKTQVEKYDKRIMLFVGVSLFAAIACIIAAIVSGNAGYITLIGLIILTAISVTYGSYTARTTLKDQLHSNIEIAEGKLAKSINRVKGRSGGLFFELEIAEKGILVDRSTYEQFQNGSYYRIYFHGVMERKILSVERLEEYTALTEAAHP